MPDVDRSLLLQRYAAHPPARVGVLVADVGGGVGVDRDRKIVVLVAPKRRHSAHSIGLGNGNVDITSTG